jgi:hypothetical protein
MALEVGDISADSISGLTLSATSFYNDSQQFYGVVKSSTAPINVNNTWRNLNNEEFDYDATRSKWLGKEFLISGARDNGATTDQFLRHSDGMPYNMNGYQIPYDATIVGIAASCNSTGTWRALISTANTLTAGVLVNLQLSSTTRKDDFSLNINVNSGQTLYLSMSGTSINRPKIDVYLKKRAN